MKNMRILKLESVLSFGKHKGKTLRQIFSGVKPILQADLAEMYFLYRTRSLGDGLNEHKLHALFGAKDWDESVPEGQQLLFHYQPNPSYIDWLVKETEDWFVDPIVLDSLQGEEILRLSTIEPPSETNDWVLTPSFATTKHQFEPLTFKVAVEKKLEWVEQRREAEERHYGAIDDGGDDYSMGSDSNQYCPACGSPSSCGCNYEMERYC